MFFGYRVDITALGPFCFYCLILYNKNRCCASFLPPWITPDTERSPWTASMAAAQYPALSKVPGPRTILLCLFYGPMTSRLHAIVLSNYRWAQVVPIPRSDGIKNSLSVLMPTCFLNTLWVLPCGQSMYRLPTS